MLAGLIRDEERRTLAGVPGLSDIPVIGRMFAYNRKQTQETDIILTLTPRIVRVLDLTEEDLAPFRVGRDGASAGGDLPPLPVPQPARPPGVQPPGGDAVATPEGPVLAPTVPPTQAPAKPVKPPPGR